MKQEGLGYLLSQIGSFSVASLLIAGLLFGLAFTYSHFWAIKKYILTGGAFKKKIFILTFIRLVVFAVALMIAAYPTHSAVRMILFFIGFMIGRIGMMRMAKREISK